jgi:CO/xanthine dehydrogenase Mo-binding subunit
MLAARVLRSTSPHARLRRVDARAAERLQGVAAVVTAADFDDKAMRLEYGYRNHERILAHGHVHYIGEPVALVAAETVEIAEAALGLIEVEYEELPAVFDALEAMQPGAPQLHVGYPGNVLVHARLRHGDLEAGFAAADVILEETYTSPAAQPAALEPQVAIAQWTEGRLTVWTASQSPFTVRQALAHIFGLPAEAVRVIVPPVGGGFGAKGNVRTQPLAAALARKTAGRPVNLTLSRAEEFVTVTKHPATLILKSGVRRDGTLTARQITAYWNIGANFSSSLHLVPAGMLRAIGPYRIAAVSVDSYGICTNLPSGGAFRGAMSSQGVWAHESHMDSLAHRLGMDPLELRLKNLLRSGDRFATGEVIQEARFAECLQAAARALGWGEPFERAPSPRLRRGRGLAVMMKNTIAASRSECRLALDQQGRLTLFTSAVELGQGAHTMLAQLAAEALGLPLSAVAVRGPDTAATPFDAQTASSRIAYMMGNAVLNGAAALQSQLRQAAAPYLGPAEMLALAEGCVFNPARPEARLPLGELVRLAEVESLEAAGAHETNGALDPETGQGQASPHWHQGAGACEVEVDVETGQVRVARYQAAAFAGRVINPALAQLQNDGNVIFGLGPALMEAIHFDGGQITNANLSDYLIPSMQDIPPELHSVSLESERGEIHGLGEMTLPPVAPAIANAIYDAVGVRLRDLPLTPERVYRALHPDGT